MKYSQNIQFVCILIAIFLGSLFTIRSINTNKNNEQFGHVMSEYGYQKCKDIGKSYRGYTSKDEEPLVWRVNCEVSDPTVEGIIIKDKK